MLGEYVILSGAGGSLLSTAGEMFTTLTNFLKTPEGWACLAVVPILFYLFKRL